jgi:lipoprotein-anchoring transpeptidase ErfK/SrfK
VTKSRLSSKKVRMRWPVAVTFSLVLTAPALFATQVDPSTRLVISVRDQKLMLLQNGGKVATYPISTSMFGLGDYWGRMTTPLGYLAVAQKIGDHAPIGAVFHNRRFTGEILAPNAPGRDPVITRIIWLRGLEAQNAHAFSRCIYIHGTPQEKTIGRPASYGCIRMKSSDVAVLYSQLTLGSIVQIVPDRLPKVPKAAPVPSSSTVVAVAETANGQDQLGSASAPAPLSVEQMRMRGALAAERQKSQARGEQTNTTRGSIVRPIDKAPPVLNKGAVTAQNSPGA